MYLEIKTEFPRVSIHVKLHETNIFFPLLRGHCMSVLHLSLWLICHLSTLSVLPSDLQDSTQVQFPAKCHQ